MIIGPRGDGIEKLRLELLKEVFRQELFGLKE
jgi:hypothetical protein